MDNLATAIEQDGGGRITNRDVWACSRCRFRNFSDRQLCCKCGTRSLGHILIFGGMQPHFSKESMLALGRKRALHASSMERPATAAGFAGYADVPTIPPYDPNVASSSNAPPPPFAGNAGGNTFNISLNLALNRQPINDQQGCDLTT